MWGDTGVKDSEDLVPFGDDDGTTNANTFSRLIVIITKKATKLHANSPQGQ